MNFQQRQMQTSQFHTDKPFVAEIAEPSVGFLGLWIFHAGHVYRLRSNYPFFFFIPTMPIDFHTF